MRSTLSSLTLAVSLFAGAVLAAACGGGTPAPQTPDTTTPAATTSPTATPTEAPTAPAPTAAPETPAQAEAMPPITASKLGDELKAIGLDINNLPTMSKLKAAERSKVMPILVKAVGIECNGCHVEENGKLDYKKSTRKKDITEHMWDEYVVSMKLSGGGALFCDSCHQGKKEFLTKDRDAVAKYMETNYVNKLESKGSDQSCATCHTADFEMNIFDKVWKVQPKKPKTAALSPTASGDQQVLGLR